MSFGIVKTAFSGYRLLRERPGTALWWLVWSLLTGVFTIAATVWMAGPQLTALKEIQAAGPGNADPATMMAISRQLLPFQAFSLLFPLFTGAISLGAANRAIFRPEGRALGYLRFGADELRLLATTAVTSGILFLVYIIVAIVAVIALVIGAGPGALKGGLAGVSLSAIAPAVLVGLAGLVLLVFLAVKLSLAPAQTVAERGIRIFSSWTLTKGRFWRILATYLLAALPVLILTALEFALMVTLNAPASGGRPNLMEALRPDLSSMAAAFGPRYLVVYAFGAVIRTLTMAALIVPTAVICKALLVPATDDYDEFD
jgi:hypothetical protein